MPPDERPRAEAFGVTVSITLAFVDHPLGGLFLDPEAAPNVRVEISHKRAITVSPGAPLVLYPEQQT